MTDFLSYQFEDSEPFINTFDEAPLWSAAFGLLLLKHLDVKKGITVVDLGSGAGFPLLEIAARFGDTSKFYGVDPWKNAVSRATQKVLNYELHNVTLIESSAEKLPFEEGSIDLIVSNLGINNFENAERVFEECNRVLKLNGKLAITTNLHGHWKEFYDVFEQTLIELNKKDLAKKLIEHQEHRGTIESVSTYFKTAGFTSPIIHQEKMEMTFADGTSFLNHYFVKLGWLDSWRTLLPADEVAPIFKALEQRLNNYASAHGNLLLTVPMAYLEGSKKSQ